MAHRPKTIAANRGQSRWLGRIGLASLAGLIALAAILLGAYAEQRVHLLAHLEVKAKFIWVRVAHRLNIGPDHDVREVTNSQIVTHFYDIDMQAISLGPFAGGRGGAFEEYGDGFIFVEPRGHLGYVSRAGHVRYLGATVPMNIEGFFAWRDRVDQGVFERYFSTMDSLLFTNADGQQTLYVSYQRFADDCIEFTVSGIDLTPGPDGPELSPDGWRDVFVANPCVPLPPVAATYEGLEAGGRLYQLSPTSMMITTGHFGFQGIMMGPAMSMDPNVDLGKTLTLDLTTGETSIFTMGHRNPEGLAIDSAGRIWETEHGPNGGDELNLLTQGENYGWPNTTYGSGYGVPRADWPLNDVQGWHSAEYAQPVYFWAPSIGVSNLIALETPEFPRWQGDLLVASLRAKSLFRLRLVDNHVVSVERIEMGQRVRDVHQLRDGAIALLTDEGEIRVLRRARTPEDSEPALAGLPNAFSGFRAIAETRVHDPAAVETTYRDMGRRLFNTYCASCHSIDGAPGVGPTLKGVFNRPVASVADYPYSDAMRHAHGRWTYDRLQRFIDNPGSEVEGARMPRPPIHVFDIQAVVDYVRHEGADGG